MISSGQVGWLGALHLAAIVDDYLMKVTHVIRGSECCDLAAAQPDWKVRMAGTAMGASIRFPQAYGEGPR